MKRSAFILLLATCASVAIAQVPFNDGLEWKESLIEARGATGWHPAFVQRGDQPFLLYHDDTDRFLKSAEGTGTICLTRTVA